MSQEGGAGNVDLRTLGDALPACSSSGGGDNHGNRDDDQQAMLSSRPPTYDMLQVCRADDIDACHVVAPSSSSHDCAELVPRAKDSDISAIPKTRSPLYNELYELIYIWFSITKLYKGNDDYKLWLNGILSLFQSQIDIDDSMVPCDTNEAALPEFFKRRRKLQLQLHANNTLVVSQQFALVLFDLRHRRAVTFDSRINALLNHFCVNLDIKGVDLSKVMKALQLLERDLEADGEIGVSGPCSISQYLVAGVRSPYQRLYDNQTRAVRIALATIIGGLSLSVSASITTPVLIVNALSLIKLQVVMNTFLSFFSPAVFAGITNVLAGLIAGVHFCPSLVGLISFLSHVPATIAQPAIQTILAVIGGGLAGMNMSKRLDRSVSIHLERVFKEEKTGDRKYSNSNDSSSNSSSSSEKDNKTNNRYVMLLINSHLCDSMTDLQVWRTMEPDTISPKNQDSSTGSLDSEKAVGSDGVSSDSERSNCSDKGTEISTNTADISSNDDNKVGGGGSVQQKGDEDEQEGESDEEATKDSGAQSCFDDEFEVINLKISQLWEPVARFCDVRLLRWCDSASLSFVTESIVTSISKQGSEWLAEKALSAMSPIGLLFDAVAWPMYIVDKCNDINNPWLIQMKKADDAGVFLAKLLLNSARSHVTTSGDDDDEDALFVNLTSGVDSRSVSMAGYGFGARVIFQCLLSLHQSGDPLASGLVENVFLLGTPLGISLGDWKLARGMVAGRFVNGYSKRDITLHTYYRKWSWNLGVAGLREVQINIDNNDSGSSSYGGQKKGFFQRIFGRVKKDIVPSSPLLISSYDEVEDFNSRNSAQGGGGGGGREGTAQSTDKDEIGDSYVYIDTASVVPNDLIENIDLGHLVASQNDYAQNLDKILELIKLV